MTINLFLSIALAAAGGAFVGGMCGLYCGMRMSIMMIKEAFDETPKTEKRDPATAFEAAYHSAPRK